MKIEQQKKFLSDGLFMSVFIELINRNNGNADIFGESIKSFNTRDVVFTADDTQALTVEQQRFLDVCEKIGLGPDDSVEQQSQDGGSAESQIFKPDKISIDIKKFFSHEGNASLSDDAKLSRMNFFVEILKAFSTERNSNYNQFIIKNLNDFPQLGENDLAKKYQHELQQSLDQLTNTNILFLLENNDNPNANNFELSNYLQMISARNILMNIFQLTSICRIQSSKNQISLSDSFVLQLLTKPYLLNEAIYANNRYFNVFSLQPAPDKVPETMHGNDINEKKRSYIQYINSNLLSMYPLYFQKITDIIAKNPVVAKSYTGLNFSLPFEGVEPENRNQVLQNSLEILNKYFAIEENTTIGENTLGNVHNFYISIEILSTEALSQLVDFAKKLTNKHHIVLKYTSIAEDFVYSVDQSIANIPCLLTLIEKGKTEQIVSTNFTNKKIDNFYETKQTDTNANIKNLYNDLMQQRNNYARHARLSFDQENAQEHNEIEQNLPVVSNDTGKKFTAKNYVSALDIEVVFEHEQEQEEEQEEDQQQEQQQNQEQQQATATDQENDFSTHDNDDSDFEKIIYRRNFQSFRGNVGTDDLLLLDSFLLANFFNADALFKQGRNQKACEFFWELAISSSDNKTYAIKGVTKTAMDFILHHPELFVNGINVDNLPKGFFVFNKNNEHLLGYDVYGFRSENNTNPLTPCVEMTLPSIDYTDVMGDHRQLNSADNSENIENEDNRIFWDNFKKIKEMTLRKNDEENKQIISQAMSIFKKIFSNYDSFFSELNFDNLSFEIQQKLSLFLCSTFIKTGVQPTKRLLDALQYMANTNATLFHKFIDSFVSFKSTPNKYGVSFLQPDCLDKIYELAKLDAISLEWWNFCLHNIQSFIAMQILVFCLMVFNILLMK